MKDIWFDFMYGELETTDDGGTIAEVEFRYPVRCTFSWRGILTFDDVKSELHRQLDGALDKMGHTLQRNKI